MDKLNIKISEQEAYPLAENRFVKMCKFDLTKPKHQRMMQMGLKVREDGLAGVNIRCLVNFYDGSCFSDGIVNADGTEITCNFFSQIPNEAVRGVYIYMLTSGEVFFSSEENIMDFLYADLWGTSYTDAGTDILSERLKEDMLSRFGGSEEVELTPEFGPGYFGMPVIETKKFDRILDGSKIGVRIKESGLIIPQKSISGLFLVLDKSFELPVEPECLSCAGNAKGCAFCQVRAKKEARLGL